ncbi:hypothetical protein KP509_21G078000 [Ceratopteris richardii]|uniref:WAT1-related protein n=1 Tax=Ceratopteris richardii TaxID=49495 RepID=A0A8T2SD62_CERRI|nr:hypothetical protein KP509_21G078000 [Ceratopteris richardii]
MAGGDGSTSSSSSWLSLVVLHTALLFASAGLCGYQIITRVALTGGMSLFTFSVYRGAIGLCFLIPAGFFLERNKRPPLTCKLLGHFFLLGLTGVSLTQACLLEGLTYTSPTFASPIQNSIPAITFIIAVAFGQERVHVKGLDGLAKIMGFILTNCAKSFQSPVIKQYPARLSVTAFTNFFGTLQLLVLALCIERNPSKWILTEAREVLSVLYAGLVVSGLVLSLQMWCVQKGGAVITAVYQPVQTIIVAVLTFLFLREDFFLGSLVGGLLIIGGLYLVIWGQVKERKLAASSLRTSIVPCTDNGKANLARVIFDDNSKENPTLTQRLLAENDSKTDAVC